MRGQKQQKSGQRYSCDAKVHRPCPDQVLHIFILASEKVDSFQFSTSGGFQKPSMTTHRLLSGKIERSASRILLVKK